MSRSRKTILILGTIPFGLYVWGFWIDWKAAALTLLAATIALILNGIERRTIENERKEI